MDSTGYRRELRGRVKEHPGPRTQDMVGASYNSGITGGNATNAGNQIATSSSPNSETFQSNYAAIAALDIDKWVGTFGELSEQSQSNYDYSSGVGHSGTELRPHNSLQGTQRGTNARWEASTQGHQKNPVPVGDMRGLAEDQKQLRMLPAQQPVGPSAQSATTDPSQTGYTQSLPVSQPAQAWQYSQPAPQHLEALYHKMHERPPRAHVQHSNRREQEIKTPSSSHKVQKLSYKSRASRRGGRPVPPPETDPRWNIWTLGNMDIRYNSGGVTVKHLQEVLYRLDECKRTKHPHESLKNQIVERRKTFEAEKPEGWKPTQGWWDHIDPDE